MRISSIGNVSDSRFWILGTALIGLALVTSVARAQKQDAQLELEAQAPAVDVQVVSAEPAPAESVVVVETPGPRHHVGLDAALVVPVGDYAHVADVGFGALIRYDLEIIPQLRIGFRGGYIHHVGEISSGLIPLMAAATYRFLPGDSSPYVRGELGVTIIWASANTAFGTVSDTDSQLALLVGAGYDMGPVDLGAALYLPDADDAVGFLFTAGVELATF